MNEKESIQETISKGALGFVVGISLLFAGYWSGRQLHNVWNVWPLADGVVVRSTVAEVLEVPSAKGDAQIHQFEPKVDLRYRVLGREYTTEAALGFTTASYQKAISNLLSSYAPGMHVPIRYNPQAPKDIRFGKLERGPLAFAFALIMAGVILSVGGVNDLMKGYSRRSRRVPELAKDAIGATLPFEGQKPDGPAAAAVRCAACGAMVEVGKDACPKCLKSLRAA